MLFCLSETLSEARAGAVTSLVSKLTSALVECSDDKFTDRVEFMNKLLDVWSEGEEVELRCNEPQQPITAQLSAADVQLLVNRQSDPGLLS